jgi:carboxyl-terminal processing protease
MTYTKKSRRIIITLVVVLCMLFSQTTVIFAQTESLAKTESSSELVSGYLDLVVKFIQDSYKGNLTDRQLVEGSLNGMLNNLDPYTTFYTPEQANDFIDSIDGTFYGIGISMEQGQEYVMVSQVFKGSPAERAGLLQGDKIVEVSGKDMKNLSMEEISSYIKGEEGTSVKIGIARKNVDEIIYLEVLREKIKISPVRYEIKDGIAYIKIDSFNSNTDYFFSEALAEMFEKNVKDIILDLRDNPGGEVNQAVAVAQKLVPAGVITRLDFKPDIYQDEEYRSYLSKSELDLAVLVNSLSASAAEIVAGAVQDSDAGVIIGTKTFGKAKVQGVIPLLTPEATLKYKSLLGVSTVDANDIIYRHGIMPLENEIIGYTKMTIGLYYTPSGKMIDGKGIIPDIKISDTKAVNGIYISEIEKLSATVKPDLNDRGHDVYNAEKILKLLGYEVDTPDTILDEKTFTAITKFQKDSKLYPYGVLDFTTQKALNQALDEAILKHDKQYAKAVEILSSN